MPRGTGRKGFLLPLVLGSVLSVWFCWLWGLPAFADRSCPSFSWEGIPTPASEAARAYHEHWDPPEYIRHHPGRLHGYIKQTGVGSAYVQWLRRLDGVPVCVKDLKIHFGLSRARVSVLPSLRWEEERRKVMRHERCHHIYYIDVSRRLRAELESEVRALLSKPWRSPGSYSVGGSRISALLAPGAPMGLRLGRAGHLGRSGRPDRPDPLGVGPLVNRYLKRLELEIYQDPRHAAIDRTRYTGMDCRGVQPFALPRRGS